MNNIFDTHAHYSSRQFDADRAELLTALPAGGVVGCAGMCHAFRRCCAGFGAGARRALLPRRAGHPPGEPDRGGRRHGGRLPRGLACRAGRHAPAVCGQGRCGGGEIGLDHHWPVPRQEQYDLFEAQLQLAKEFDLPVSVHDREAHAEMYELLRKYKPRGALHCYSGSADDAAWLVEQGMYLGFGGAVTYKGAKRAARVLAAIPHDRALLETDCPYMAPEPVRGTRNDSRNIVHVAAYIGTLWDMDAQAVLDQTAANARACFGV